MVFPADSKIWYFRPFETIVPWAYLCAMVYIQQHSLALLSRGVGQVKHGEAQRYSQLVVDIFFGKKPWTMNMASRGELLGQGMAFLAPLNMLGKPPAVERRRCG